MDNLAIVGWDSIAKPHGRDTGEVHLSTRTLASYEFGGLHPVARALFVHLCTRAAMGGWWPENDPMRINRMFLFGSHRSGARTTRKHLDSLIDGGFLVKTSERRCKIPVHDQTKQEARQAVSYAIRVGTLVRPDDCSECAGPGPVDAHHHNYDRPLSVVWLCRPCHMRHHAEERE